MRRFLAFFFFFFLFVLFNPLHIQAQDSGWVINSFDSEVLLQSSGVVRVDEKIAVDFRTLEKHGIYRDIPYVYQNDDGSKRYAEIEILRVSQDGEKASFDVSRNENHVRIKIGEANRSISGKHLYEITYTAKGILQSFSDYDELNWNVTGDQWAVHILKASVKVIASGKGGIEKVACYQGYSGSTAPCEGAIVSPKLATFTANGFLGSNEGMTIVVGYQKGLLPILVVQKPKTFFDKFFAWPSLMTLLIIFLSGCGAIIFLWYRYGRDNWFSDRSAIRRSDQSSSMPLGAHETIVVEYEPPGELRPAEIGVLTDERADTLDVVATIIDLAARGYLIIKEIDKTWLFGKTDYSLIQTDKKPAGFKEYETSLFNKLFKNRKEVKISSLKQTFYEELSEIKQLLYKQVVADELFFVDPEKIRTKYLIIGILVCVLGVAGLIFSIKIDAVLLSDMSIGVSVVGLVLAIASRFMPQRTANGRELFRRVKGYELFLSTAEKHRQQFFEKKNMLSEVLPYVIVFGLTAKFARAMKDIGISEKDMIPAWYYGVHPFSLNNFSTSMNNFSTSLSTAISAAPKSSGFSSGGGFSGGGFGGGGGGSW